ncbi:TLC domain-containing protein 1 isoform X2 [Ambystoma mexicanum]|uniref:TLC domain-containing protein 1 isoform X2 n=1 Tax=Ambystoma mexicanum TaxID=8296 RepID=UPI0037E84312
MSCAAMSCAACPSLSDSSTLLLQNMHRKTFAFPYFDGTFQPFIRSSYFPALLQASVYQTNHLCPSKKNPVKHLPQLRSVLQFPDILTNVKDCSPKPAYLLLCASLGYFLMDAADIIMNGQAKASWEFLLHHALVISSFTYAAFTGRYVAGTTIALFVEVNSIFLHTRLMLKLCSAQDSPLYRVNRYLNLLTFISFRLGAHAFLTWYLLWNFLTLPHGTFFMTTVGTIDIVILVYFYRLVRADFFPKTKHLQGVRETYSEKKFLTD